MHGKGCEYCVICGEIIPEGRQVCPKCEKESEESDIIRECKCAECGKVFIPACEHAYKINDKIFCKYTCMLHYRERKKQNKTYKSRGLK